MQVGTDDDRTVEIKNIGTGDLLICVPSSAITTTLSWSLLWRTREDADAVGLKHDGTDLFQYPFAVPGGESLFLVLNYKPASDEVPVGKIVLNTNLPDPVIEIPVELTDAALR